MQLTLETEDGFFCVSGHDECILIRVSVEYSVFGLTPSETEFAHHLTEEVIPLSSGLFEAIQCTL